MAFNIMTFGVLGVDADALTAGNQQLNGSVGLNELTAANLINANGIPFQQLLLFVGAANNGDLNINAGETAFNLSDMGAGGAVVSLGVTNTNDPVRIRANGLTSANTVGDLTGNVYYDNTRGFGLANVRDKTAASSWLNAGDSLTFSTMAFNGVNQFIASASFVVAVNGGGSEHVIIDFDGNVVRQNGTTTAVDGIDLGLIANGTTVSLNFVANTISIGATTRGMTDEEFSLFQQGGLNQVTIGSHNTSTQGFAIKNLSILATDTPVSGVVVQAPATGGETHGTANDDILIGSAVVDVLNSGAGNDVIYGGGGADTINAGDGNDRAEGGVGDDIINGGAGNDILVGGVGDDTLTGGGDADAFVFRSLDELSANTDHITDFEPGVDTIDLSAIGGLTFIGQSAFTGVAGQMRFDVASGTTEIQIDADGDSVMDDRIVIDNGQFNLTETAPGSLVLETKPILGTAEDDVLNGVNGFDEQIFGLAGADFVFGGAGNDTLDGGEGNDWLFDEQGFNRLLGGAGDDLLSVNLTANFIDGGEGLDKLELYRPDLTENVTVTSVANGDVNSYTFALSDGTVVQNIEQLGSLTTGSGNDTVTFTNLGLVSDAAWWNTVQSFRGEGGIDTAVMDFSSFSSDVIASFGEIPENYYIRTVDLSGQIYLHDSVENVVLYGGGGNDTFTRNDGANTLVGNGGNDTIIGGGSNDIIDGGDGDDTLNGGSGNDTIDGGEGNDGVTLNFSSSTSSVTMSVALTSSQTEFFDAFDRPDGTVGSGWLPTSGNGNGDIIIEGQRLTVPTAHGEAGIYRPVDLSGPVTVSATITQLNGYGGVGNRFFTTILYGNAGDMSSGYGVAFVRSDDNTNNSMIVLVSAGGEAGVDASSAIVLADFQFDTLITPTITFFPDGSITGSVTGNNGQSFYFSFDAATPHPSPAGNNIAIIQVFPSDDGTSTYIFPTVDNVSIETNSPHADGNITDGIRSVTFANVESVNVVGGSASDTLIGGGAGDTLDGGEGNDALGGGNGNDTLVGGDGNDALDAAAGNDSLDGGQGDDTVSGGIGDDTLSGGVGDDALDGGYGSDELIGGDGNDTFVFQAGQANGDSIVDFAGNGADVGDTLVFSGYGTVAEGATFTQVDATHWQINSADGTVQDVITLADGASIDPSDLFFGNAVIGGGGDDFVFGGGGDDYLYGGAGNDWLFDEHGFNRLNGGPGDDLLSINLSPGIFDGGAGIDKLEFYRPDLTENVTVTYVANGDVNSYTFALSDGTVVQNIEQLGSFATGSGNDTVTFTNLGLVDVQGFDGGDGIDTAIADYSSFSVDVSTSGGGVAAADVTGILYLLVENWVLSGGSGNDSLVHNSGDNIFAGNGGDDTLITGDGNDTLDGGDGTDTLNGGAGDDLLMGGSGNDTLTGGAGDDTFVFQAGQANGDIIVDFAGIGAGAGDTLVFSGYGTVAEGATFTQVDATHWQINSADGTVHDIITLANGASIDPSDYFVGNPVIGGGGNDFIDGGAGDDLLIGGAGDDRLFDDTGFNRLLGGPGDDLLSINTSPGVFDGGPGLDKLELYRPDLTEDVTVTYVANGDVNSYTFTLSDGTVVQNMELLGSFTTGSGDDTVTFTNLGLMSDAPWWNTVQSFRGEGGIDTAIVDFSSFSSDVVVFGSGYYQIETVDQSARIYLHESVENWVLSGGSGNDSLVHNSGDNIFAGNGGDDTLITGDGNDTLDGGDGTDTLNGGSGADTFIFKAGQANGDTVLDFEGNGPGAGDLLMFGGYGTAAEGATFVQIDATHWQINSADGLIHDVITLANGATVDASDYFFGP
jgi:Ca2+-binding RTX toxin-like protein